MRYRLDELASLATQLGFESRRVDADRVDVAVMGSTLAFCNLAGNDTLVGFDGTPWHAHGVLHIGTGDATFVECDELELLVGLSLGELVIVSTFLDGVLHDRWIAHRSEPLRLRYIRPGEEIRVYRLPERTRGG